MTTKPGGRCCLRFLLLVTHEQRTFITRKTCCRDTQDVLSRHTRRVVAIWKTCCRRPWISPQQDLYRKSNFICFSLRSWMTNSHSSKDSRSPEQHRNGEIRADICGFGAVFVAYFVLDSGYTFVWHLHVTGSWYSGQVLIFHYNIGDSGSNSKRMGCKLW